MCYNDVKIQAIQYYSVSIDGKVSGGLRLSVFVYIACRSLLAYHNPLGHFVDKICVASFTRRKQMMIIPSPNTKFLKKKKFSTPQQKRSQQDQMVILCKGEQE